MGSGNESEIFTVMLDKSTYFKKVALFSTQSVFFMYCTSVWDSQNLYVMP